MSKSNSNTDEDAHRPPTHLECPVDNCNAIRATEAGIKNHVHLKHPREVK